MLFLKKMRKILAFLLALAMALTLCACAKPTPIATGKNTVGVKDGETLGQGATAFTVEVTDGQGTKTDFTVKTDEKTVGAALQALNISAARRATTVCISRRSSALPRTMTRTAHTGPFTSTDSMPPPAWI